MLRFYIRKTSRASYTSDDLKRAIADVKSGAALLPTAKKYSIAARTLRRHKNNQLTNPGHVQLGRFRPNINAEYEAQLVSIIQDREKNCLV